MYKNFWSFFNQFFLLQSSYRRICNYSSSSGEEEESVFPFIPAQFTSPICKAFILVFAVGRQKFTAPTSTAVDSNRPDRGRLFGRKFGRIFDHFSVKLGNFFCQFHGKMVKSRFLAVFRSFFRPVGQNRPAVGRQKFTAPTSTAVDSNRPDRGRLFGRKFGRNLTIFL